MRGPRRLAAALEVRAPSRASNWSRWLCAALLLGGGLGACTLGPEAIPGLGDTPHRYGNTEVPEAELARIWTSYQIAVPAIDGVATDYSASERCVYYLIALPAGPHELELRLDYESPTHRVYTEETVRRRVDLEAGQSYTLLDLSAGIRRERVFSPWLLNGAPEVEDIEWAWGDR